MDPLLDFVTGLVHGATVTTAAAFAVRLAAETFLVHIATRAFSLTARRRARRQALASRG